MIHVHSSPGGRPAGICRRSAGLRVRSGALGARCRVCISQTRGRSFPSRRCRATKAMRSAEIGRYRRSERIVAAGRLGGRMGSLYIKGFEPLGAPQRRARPVDGKPHSLPPGRRHQRAPLHEEAGKPMRREAIVRRTIGRGTRRADHRRTLRGSLGWLIARPGRRRAPRSAGDHRARSAENIINVYTTFPWPALCAEVAKLKIRKITAGVARLGSQNPTPQPRSRGDP